LIAKTRTSVDGNRKEEKKDFPVIGRRRRKEKEKANGGNLGRFT
jgi:hypothetical protein